MSNIASMFSNLRNVSLLKPDYDGLLLSPPHLQRLRAEAPPNSVGTFAGIAVIENACVPEGFAVMTLKGKPVGVIDFNLGVASLIPIQKDHPIFSGSSPT